MNPSIYGENAQNQQMAILRENEDGISVPNWLVDVLKWINRVEMANSSLSYSCRMFKQLCWPKLHKNVKPHIVPYLQFYNELDVFGNIYDKLANQNQKNIPIAAIAPPEYILGFKEIIIGFVDDRVIEFAKNIGNEKIIFSIDKFIPGWGKKDAQVELIRQFLALFENNIYEISFNNYTTGILFFEFCELFPTILDQVHSIFAFLFPPDFEIVLNWLMKRRADGCQKILNYIISDPEEDYEEIELGFIGRIEQEFLNSTETSNFLIFLKYEYENYSMKNEHTGEMLTLYTEIDQHGLINTTFLARYPEEEEQQWMNGNIAKIEEENGLNIRLDMHKLEDMKNNKLDVQKSSPDLTITDEGFVVANSDSAHSYNSVQAEMAVNFQQFNLSNKLEKYIACYFEVSILNHCSGVGMGFSDENFALKYGCGSRWQNSHGKKPKLSIDYNFGGLDNSMGFWCKEGVHIDGKFEPFDKVESNDELFSQGDVLGCGLLYSHSHPSLIKFFATHNGILLCINELPFRFYHYYCYFPTITLAAPSVSIRANFGKETFCFDRSTLFKE